MSEDSSTDNGGGLWRGLRNFLFHEEKEPTLREVIEKAIEEHEHDAPDRDDLSPIERRMLRRLLHFGRRSAGDVGTPRADIVAVPDDINGQDLIAAFAGSGLSRLPVYKETLDDIIGMLHVKDIFSLMAEGQRDNFDLKSLLRQPRYVPETMGVLDLLAEMRATRTHMAIVLDEYSGTEGLITIEDLVEEIIGDIEDEHDEAPTALLTSRPDGIWEAEGRTELEDIAEWIDPHLSEVEEDVDTIGGLATVLAGHVPQRGEILEHPSGWRIEILAGDSRHVERVRLYPPKKNPDED